MTGKSKNKLPEASQLIVKEGTNNVPTAPDKHTRKDPVFFDGAAPNQVFRLHFGFVSYGTDDKGHAASLILSVMTGILLMFVFTVGLFVDRVWIPDALKLLGTAFTLVAGVAIGKGSNKK